MRPSKLADCICFRISADVMVREFIGVVIRLFLLTETSLLVDVNFRCLTLKSLSQLLISKTFEDIELLFVPVAHSALQLHCIRESTLILSFPIVVTFSRQQIFQFSGFITVPKKRLHSGQRVGYGIIYVVPDKADFSCL